MKERGPLEDRVGALISLAAAGDGKAKAELDQVWGVKIEELIQEMTTRWEDFEGDEDTGAYTDPNLFD